MKWGAILTCTLLWMPICASAQQVVEKQDSFTGATTWNWSVPNESGPSMDIDGLAPKNEPVHFLLDIEFYSNQWRYLDCHSVHWLVDGQRVNLVFHYMPHMTDDGVIEQFVLVLTPSAMKMLSDAKSIRYEICGDAYSFNSKELQGVKQIYSAVMSWSRISK